MRIYRLLSVLIIGIILISCNSNTSTPTNTGKIAGQISDFKTNKGIPLIQVTTNPPTSAIITDSVGKFTFYDVPIGQYIVYAKKYGYKGDSITISVNADKITLANFKLEPIE